MEKILAVVTALIAQWQVALGGEVEVVLGGSLVSGLFILEGAEAIDVDVRFLTDDPTNEALRHRIESVTALSFRKQIAVNDWPSGAQSPGVMVEGKLTHPELALPLDVEGCIRNRAYVGWARFYRTVFSPTELEAMLAEKLSLRADKKAYKAFKSGVIAEAQRRCLERGLVKK